MSSVQIAVAQLGARKHYQEPVLFHQWGLLNRLYTDLYAPHNPITVALRHRAIYPRIPNGVRKGLDRHVPELQQAPITQFPLFGYRYLQQLKKTPSQEVSRVSTWAGQEFCQQIIRHGLGDANTVYGFGTASLELFEYAKAQGLRCILDQVIAERGLTYQLLAEEELRWSNWSKAPFSIGDAEQELIRREHQEQAIADQIVCGSAFVKDSLVARGIPAERVCVVALGRGKGDLPPLRSRPAPKERGDGLRVLFAGAVGLRKGVPDLLTALRQLKGQFPFTCKLAGSLELHPDRLAEYQDVAEFLGRVPRSQMAQLYDWADVFVLPSIAEGSAMVTYEALLYGIPVITTYNAGSLVRDGIDGHIVSIRNPNAIAQKLAELYEADSRLSETDSREYFVDVLKSQETKLRSLICEP